jgi:hypothetical protein
MSNPEVKVRTFKQQGGESLKDAWYRISNAHHRCTKKHSTIILLRNFYVGISNWNRYVLDTLAGGNFLGTLNLEACTLIASLVGVPPIHVIKTEVTLVHLGLHVVVLSGITAQARAVVCQNNSPRR